MQLDSRQTNAVSQALALASERYVELAENVDSPTNKRVADQLRLQAIQARKFAILIQDNDEVSIQVSELDQHVASGDAQRITTLLVADTKKQRVELAAEALLKPAETQTVYVGMISHREGTTCCVSKTEESMKAQVANWCRDQWRPEGLKGEAPTDDQEAIDTYFLCLEGQESFDHHTAEVL